MVRTVTAFVQYEHYCRVLQTRFAHTISRKLTYFKVVRVCTNLTPPPLQQFFSTAVLLVSLGHTWGPLKCLTAKFVILTKKLLDPLPWVFFHMVHNLI